MAASPRWKAFRNDEYVASFHYIEDAALFVAATGGDIRDGHAKKDIVWREGAEEFSAAGSYDRVAEVVRKRLEERSAAYRASCTPTRLGDAIGR